MRGSQGNLLVSYGGSAHKTMCRWLLEKGGISSMSATFKMGHCSSPVSLNPGINKILYIYANPANAILSFLRREEAQKGWMVKHCKHIGGSMSGMNELVSTHGLSIEGYIRGGYDVMLLHRHLNQWFKGRNRSSILMVKYEEIWKNKDLICEWLGVTPSGFPVQKKRRSDWTRNKRGAGLAMILQNAMELYYMIPPVIIRPPTD